MIETRRAEKLKEQLEKLGGFTREVPQLKEASEELVYIANPSAEVKTTMKALFMLLEEPVDTLEVLHTSAFIIGTSDLQAFFITLSV